MGRSSSDLPVSASTDTFSAAESTSEPIGHRPLPAPLSPEKLVERGALMSAAYQRMCQHHEAMVAQSATYLSRRQELKAPEGFYTGHPVEAKSSNGSLWSGIKGCFS
jgi:hypothetical protein